MIYRRFWGKFCIFGVVLRKFPRFKVIVEEILLLGILEVSVSRSQYSFHLFPLYSVSVARKV